MCFGGNISTNSGYSLHCPKHIDLICAQPHFYNFTSLKGGVPLPFTGELVPDSKEDGKEELLGEELRGCRNPGLHLHHLF